MILNFKIFYIFILFSYIYCQPIVSEDIYLGIPKEKISQLMLS
jgi:hypothetical protein